MNSNRNRSRGLVGLIILGAATTILGLVFCFLLIRGYLRAAQFDSWKAVPCQVISAWVEEPKRRGMDAQRFQFQIRYRYEWDGKSYVGDRVKELDGSTKRRKKVAKYEAQFPAGTDATCFVDPENPNEAILSKPTKAPGYTVWFPGLFIAGGLGMIIAAFRRKPDKSID